MANVPQPTIDCNAEYSPLKISVEVFGAYEPGEDSLAKAENFLVQVNDENQGEPHLIRHLATLLELSNNLKREVWAGEVQIDVWGPFDRRIAASAPIGTRNETRH